MVKQQRTIYFVKMSFVNKMVFSKCIKDIFDKIKTECNLDKNKFVVMYWEQLSLNPCINDNDQIIELE